MGFPKVLRHRNMLHKDGFVEGLGDSGAPAPAATAPATAAAAAAAAAPAPAPAPASAPAPAASAPAALAAAAPAAAVQLGKRNIPVKESAGTCGNDHGEGIEEAAFAETETRKKRRKHSGSEISE